MLPALTGCVYLRLLHFKNQLKSFDENVSVLKGRELAFVFSKPIVKNSDFVFLTGSQPSRIDFADSAGDNEVWTWHFQKRTSNDSDRPFRMTFRAHFQDDLLTRFEVDKAFVELFGQDFTEEILSRMGHAKINKLRAQRYNGDRFRNASRTFPAVSERNRRSYGRTYRSTEFKFAIVGILSIRIPLLQSKVG